MLKVRVGCTTEILIRFATQGGRFARDTASRVMREYDEQ